MNKYFELQYWLTIIAICFVALFFIIAIIKFIIECIIKTYRKNSKKWEYNCVLKKYERVNKYEKDYIKKN